MPTGRRAQPQSTREKFRGLRQQEFCLDDDQLLFIRMMLEEASVRHVNRAKAKMIMPDEFDLTHLTTMIAGCVGRQYPVEKGASMVK